jgi:hypothetical protein
LSIWKKVRKIIIGLKYSQENRRLLKEQIKALKIENYKFLQLGKFLFFSRKIYYNIIKKNTNN